MVGHAVIFVSSTSSVRVFPWTGRTPHGMLYCCAAEGGGDIDYDITESDAQITTMEPVPVLAVASAREEFVVEFTKKGKPVGKNN